MSNPKGFVVFDCTDPTFYSGKLSLEFTKESDGGNRPWFFQPIEWMPNCPDDEWYGSIAGSMTKTLPIYSTGFVSEEAASYAITVWEATIRRREKLRT